MSLFGEIVEPVSRTAWEDWDEVNPDINFTELQWSEDVEAPDHLEIIFIFEGKFLLDCIKSQSFYKLELINTIKDINLKLYKITDSNNYFCIIHDYNLIQSSEIVHLLGKYLAVARDVIAIQTKPLAEYNALIPAESCIIRTLVTSKQPVNVLNLNYPKLEQPNIISGISAGVISLREHMNQTGLGIVCYIEHSEEDEMQDFLKKLNIRHTASSSPSSILNSNLYM